MKKSKIVKTKFYGDVQPLRLHFLLKYVRINSKGGNEMEQEEILKIQQLNEELNKTIEELKQENEKLNLTIEELSKNNEELNSKYSESLKLNNDLITRNNELIINNEVEKVEEPSEEQVVESPEDLIKRSV